MSNSAIKPAFTNFPESRRILFIWIISPSFAGTDARASWRKCDWKCALAACLHAAPPAHAPGWRSCRVALIIIQLPGFHWTAATRLARLEAALPPSAVTEPSVRGSPHYSCLIRPRLRLPEPRPGAPLLPLNHPEPQRQQRVINRINSGP